MATVTQYRVRFFGGPHGTSSIRAQIELFGDAGRVGLVNFQDAGEPPRQDKEAGGQIEMNLPSALLGPVIDVLRNEQPVNFAFVASAHVGELSTGQEAVGEGES